MSRIDIIGQNGNTGEHYDTMNDYQKYYVYSHINPETQEVLYVGLGQYERAWNFKRFTSRSKEHSTFLMYLYDKGYTPDEWVNVIFKGLTRVEAVAKERELILKHAPRFNKMHNPTISLSRVPSEVKKFWQKLRSIGYSYTHIAYLSGADGEKSRDNTKAMTVWRTLK